VTGRERLTAVLEGRTPDRVPISTYELVGWNPDSFENKEPSYARLMEVIRERTDCMYRWAPPRCQKGLGYFLSATEEVAAEHRETVEGDTARTVHVIHTPRGDLRARTAVREGLHTTWKEEPFVKDAEDIERVLSVPYEPAPVDCSSLATARERVGEHGITKASIADALCCVCELFEFGEFTVWALTERETVRRLLDVFHARVMDRLRAMLDGGAGPLFRIVGAEYATPPYMPPELFAEYVVPYEREMTELIHSRGGWSRIHCHGRIAEVTDHILAIGADATDPVEPPPQGDIELAEAKRRLGEELCIMGNLELSMLEIATPKQVRAEAARCMEAAKPGGRYVIMPTSAPIDVPLKKRTEENYLAFIDAARELGAY